jgi:hypothetical protein
VAGPEQHKDIERLIGEMRADQDAPLLKTYAVTHADPTLLVPMIQGLFTGEPRVQLTADPVHRRLVAVATPKQHETIARVIRESEEEPEEAAGRSLEVYSLEQSDPTGLQEVLTKLFQRASVPPEWSVDTRAQRLVAIATDEQHEVIRSAVERLKRAERQVEVFQLHEVDPLAAETAIENLFESAAGDGRAAPHVEADYQSQRLLVRGDAEQIEQIRDVLQKMGETGLADASAGSSRRFRVVPFDGDAEAVLREIERIWPQLRKNALKVVTPSAVAPELRQSRGENPEGTPEAPPRSPVTPQLKRSLGEEPEGTPEAPPRVPPQTTSEGHSATTESPEKPQPKSDTQPEPPADESRGPEQSAEPPASSEGSSPPGSNASRDAGATADPTKPPAVQPDTVDEPRGPQTPPPVIAAPGRGSITIASDDPQALEQLEALVRGFSAADVLGESDMEIFPLQNADAFQFAQAVRELLRNRPIDRRNPFASISIVPDQRTNSVVVRASRSDRQVIEELVRSLDIGDLPGVLAMNKPTVIPLENLMANEVIELLEDVYRTQLTAGGGREPIPVPSGVPRDVAAILEQINAAKTGPLMTLSVDPATNSLVVLAPLPLLEEVQSLVLDLDRAADEKPARSLKIVTLKKANVESVEQALERVLQDRGSGRSRSRRR